MNIKPRQLEILEAAGSLLNEEGIGGLTIKKLAERVGFTESALYRHYPGKEAVLLSLLDYLHDCMEEYLLPQSERPPVEQFQELLERHLTFLAKHPHFVTAVFSEGLLHYSSLMRERQLRLMKLMQTALETIIEKGQQASIFTNRIPVAELTHIVMGALRLLMLRWLISGFKFDVVNAGRKHINNLVLLISKK